MSFNKNSLTQGTDFDYVTRTSQNQGILQETGFVNQTNLNPSGTWSLGLLQMDFFYRERKWYAGQFVRMITPKIELTKSSVLYFTAILNKQKKNLLSGLVRDVDKSFLNTKIQLPLKNKEIDFEFIESFISNLETQHIDELETQRTIEINAFLLASGLQDYNLTIEEQTVLDSFENIAFETFNLKNLFGKSTRGLRLKSTERISGTLPFVTAGEFNDGISAYIGNDVKIFSENTTTIDMFGSAKYRNYKYGGDDHVAIVHTENLTKLASLYVTSAIHKTSYTGKFSYSNNFYAKDADELNICLPSVNKKPNYSLMETFINAIQKLVIKDVFLNANNRIKATKDVVSKL